MSLKSQSENSVNFFLNGTAVSIQDPDPGYMLIDYLRSAEIGLAGPKKACGQGGCGSCTVILSSWKNGAQEHRAINSCLRPICALNGLVVTTVEGTGTPQMPPARHLMHATTASRNAGPLDNPPPSYIKASKLACATRESLAKTKAARLSTPLGATTRAPLSDKGLPNLTGINPVAHRLAVNNGSQCGYCTVGFVMNMSEFIVNNPKATQRQIEDIFDGNLCRCTGYRPILTGMKTFASDWHEEDESKRMKCFEEGDQEAQLPATAVNIPFPSEAQVDALPVTIDAHGKQWLTPTSRSQASSMLIELMKQRKSYQFINGNTSFGIYKEECLASQVYIDVRYIRDLVYPIPDPNSKYKVTVSAAITFTDLIDVLENYIKLEKQSEESPAAALLYMARRTAGRIVRNAATLGGNTMLAVKHYSDVLYLEPGFPGRPFPSDTLTTLVAINAYIGCEFTQNNQECHDTSQSASDFISEVRGQGGLYFMNLLIKYYAIDAERPNQIVIAQKAALREVNSHAIVNMTMNTQWSQAAGSSVWSIAEAKFVFGGIDSLPWNATQTEAYLCQLEDAPSAEELAHAIALLETEVKDQLASTVNRRAAFPDEGFTDAYRTELAVSMFYKALVRTLTKRNLPVSPSIVSAGDIKWGTWDVSGGVQSYATPETDRPPVGLPYIKNTALYQAVGQMHYTHELQLPPRGAHGAFVQSTRALADFFFCAPDSTNDVTVEVLKDHLKIEFGESFIDLITEADVPQAGLNLQGIGLDQPLFATKSVHYAGQSIALVIASSENLANTIAEFVTDQCIGYRAVSWEGDWPNQWNEPVLSIEEAIRQNSIFPDAPSNASYVAHIWKITRRNSNLAFIDGSRDVLARDIKVGDIPSAAGDTFAGCLLIENSQRAGAQAHFYMETQSCLVVPQDGGRLIVHPSTQSPMEMHQTAAMAIGVPYNRIDVRVAPVGGGFGGKTEQARFVTGPAVVAAYALDRPIRVVLPREVDTKLIGKRHAYFGQCQVAVDKSTYKIKGFSSMMWGDGGAYYDCSFIVSNCIQLRADNAYNVPNFVSQIDVCRTNTAPSTAMRSFGDLQGKNIIENAIDDTAVALGISAELLRETNFYTLGDETPFGQVLDACYIQQVWKWLKNKCDFAIKSAAVDAFNSQNKWLKRGIAMIPVKYGSGYNFLQLEQAGGIAVINQADGTVTLHQSGVEMGQGLLTQVQQVASYVLNIPIDMIHVESPRTSITPNPTSTGASTGTQYNCEVAKSLAQKLKDRLTAYGSELKEKKGEEWCVAHNVDFWNYPDGWAHEVTAFGRRVLIWQLLIQQAYSDRIDLLASFTVPIEGGEKPVPWMEFKPMDQQPKIPGITVDQNASLGGGVDSFVGFTYSAACSVVEVDILTGEVKILSADIAYDMGWSMNPAIDIGQVEGAFIQGVGYLLSEELVFEPEGDEKGRLNTDNTWQYKVPAHASIPLEMNVHLFPRNDPSVVDIPLGLEHGIYSSKEVGEPPMVLANSVFFAVKAAIRASRAERGLDKLFFLDAPATVQEVRRACCVKSTELTFF